MCYFETNVTVVWIKSKQGAPDEPCETSRNLACSLENRDGSLYCGKTFEVLPPPGRPGAGMDSEPLREVHEMEDERSFQLVGVSPHEREGVA